MREPLDDLPFVRREVSKEEALALFQKLGEKFKVEIVNDIFAKGAKTLTLYSHGDWVDFCLGPHAPSTGKVGVIKLLNVAGAYWRGDHRNPCAHGSPGARQTALGKVSRQPHSDNGAAFRASHLPPCWPRRS